MSQDPRRSYGPRVLWRWLTVRLTFPWWMTVGLVLSLAAAWWLRPDSSQHGLVAQYPSGSTRVERVAFVTANDLFYTGEDLSILWTGYLYQPTRGTLTFRVPANVQARLQIDDRIVFERSFEVAARDELAQAVLESGLHAIHLEITAPEKSRDNFVGGLEWQTPWGWRLVPAVYLYPKLPDLAQADLAARRAQWARWSASLAGLLLCGLGGWAVLTLVARTSRRLAMGLGVCLLFALSLRLAIFHPLVSRLHYERFCVGCDQRAYQFQAQEMLRGHYPRTRFSLQPGLSLTLGMLYGIWGLHLRLLPLLQTISGAFLIPLVYDLTRRTFSFSSAWIAVLLWMTFPLAMFYESQLLTHGLEVQMGALLVWLWLRATTSGRARRIWWWLGLGLALGASSVWRPTFLILAPCAAVSIAKLSPSSWKTKVGYLAALTLATLVPIAPITWHNYQASGRFQLISGHTSSTLYLGNNRDSSGVSLATPATWATSTLVRQGVTTYTQQTLADILANPMRWVRLMLRKVALYLGDREMPNNVDFYLEGISISPLLAALPMRFGSLLVLALAATVLVLRRQLPLGTGVWIIWIYLVAHMLVTIIQSAFSRFRTPLYGPLIVLAAGGLTRIVGQTSARRWREAGVSLLVLLIGSAFVTAMPRVSERVMRPPTVASLPSGVQMVNAPLGPAVSLIGYDDRPLPTDPGERLVLTFYWQSQASIGDDLYTTIRLLDSAGQWIGKRRYLGYTGTGSYPPYTTRHWRSGDIVRDPYALPLTSGDPMPAAFVLTVSSKEPTPDRPESVTVGPVPLGSAAPVVVPSNAIPVNATVGSACILAYQVAIDEGVLRLTLYWQASGPIQEDGIVFVHLFDETGQFVTGQDHRPQNGLSSTQAWQPGATIVDTHRLLLPTPTGDRYHIVIGMYSAQNQARLPIFDALGNPMLDNVLPLGDLSP